MIQAANVTPHGQGAIEMRKTVALFLWGNVVEDFLDTLGVPLETFCTEFVGSWIFGYVDALQSSGLNAVVFCVSGRVRRPVHFWHRPTGSTVCVLPATRIYRALSRFMCYPYGRTGRDVFGGWRGPKRVLRPLFALLQPFILYLPTPPVLLARELLRLRCSAMICQEYEYPRFDVSVLIGRILNIPVFATFQGGNYHHSVIERFVRPLAFRFAAGAFIASTEELERVHDRYRVPRAKLFRVFNPIELEDWGHTDTSAARQELGIPPDAKVVAWHGRVDFHRKGLDILLDAWARICETHPEGRLQLLLIGSGLDDAQLQRYLDERDLAGVIWIREFVHDRERIRRCLSASDVYAFPSRHEGFAVAPLEAMACGLPVVAAAAPGIPDLLEEGERSGGIMVPRENPEELARALSHLLTDDALRADLGHFARARVLAFSKEAVGSQLHAALALAGTNSRQGSTL